MKLLTGIAVLCYVGVVGCAAYHFFAAWQAQNTINMIGWGVILILIPTAGGKK